jgi:hypothetical protein
MATDPEPPIRNASLMAAAVYSHSGEFAPTYTDLRLPGRGIALVLDRSYRSSLAEAVGLLGRGWTSCLDRRIETVGDDLVHHDPTGRTQVFTRGLARIIHADRSLAGGDDRPVVDLDFRVRV